MLVVDVLVVAVNPAIVFEAASKFVLDRVEVSRRHRVHEITITFFNVLHISLVQLLPVIVTSWNSWIIDSLLYKAELPARHDVS